MNYLAHLVLAGVSPSSLGDPPGIAEAGRDASESLDDHRRPVSRGKLVLADPLQLVGNLLPDFARDTPALRGARAETHPDLPASVRQGVIRHRLIDRITDTHPAFLRTRARLRSRYARFAGVMADVLFDHALSLRWDRIVAISRKAFIASAYAALQTEQAHAVMPPAMRRTIDAMIEHAWPDRYATVPGLERTFFELSYRFTRRYGRPTDLAGIATHLNEHRGALLLDFDELWTFLIGRVSRSPSD